MPEGRKRRLVERIADPMYLEDLGDKSLEELRAMREECRDGETELSFERRLCQARIDILSTPDLQAMRAAIGLPSGRVATGAGNEPCNSLSLRHTVTNPSCFGVQPT